MQTLAYRDAETYRAYLVDLGSDGIGVAISRPSTTGDVWDGLALFPRELAEEAEERYQELETDSDAEDLIREWADPEGRELLAFISAAATEPPMQLIPTASLTGRAKKKKTEDEEEEVEKAPPWSTAVARQFPRPRDADEDEVTLLPLNQYDNIIVSFSGGKDSVACVLYLLELGVPPERIELWHQCVDGRPGVDERLWDWPCTEAYCHSFAEAFGMRLLYQWLEKGYLGELMKENALTKPTSFQMLDGSVKTLERGGEPATRLVFPAMVADLRTRWCSAYLKIDVAKKVFTNDPRFAGARTLIVTGERRQESANRARYSETVDYASASTKKRMVHQWRAILSWYEDDVWEIFERYRVRPHPAYYLGWSRVSCLPCIFGDPNQWATISEILPKIIKRLGDLEVQFGYAAQTMPNHPRSRESQYRRWEFKWSPDGQRKAHAVREKKLAKKLGRRFVPTPFVLQPAEPFKFKPFDGFLRGENESIPEAAARGESYPIPYGSKFLKLGISEHLPEGYARLDDGETWEMPMGAFGHSGGPT